MKNVKLLENTNYKELEKNINKWIEYNEQNEEDFIDVINITLTSASIVDEYGDYTIYYTATILFEVCIDNNN
jgi:hypothetical protein